MEYLAAVERPGDIDDRAVQVNCALQIAFGGVHGFACC